MMAGKKEVLAIDIGTSSGKAVKAEYDGHRLTCSEIYNFGNQPIYDGDTLCWNYKYIIDEIYTAIQKAGYLDSISFDTWRSDFGLLDDSGALLLPPICFRDTHSAEQMNKLSSAISNEELYSVTGTNIKQYNTIYQLLSIKENNPKVFSKAERVLFMPDLISYSLTHNQASGLGIASASGIIDHSTTDIAADMLRRIGITPDLFANVIDCGSVYGKYRNSNIITSAGHAAGCAAAAVSALNGEAALISCGARSIVSAVVDSPVVTQEAQKNGFTNEYIPSKKVNLLKDFGGMSLVQQSRKFWSKSGYTYSFENLEMLAWNAEKFKSFIDPESVLFLNSPNIPDRINEFCKITGQDSPAGPGEFIRCIYESLAFKYRFTLEKISEITGKKINDIYLIGGGSKDMLMARMIADCTGTTVTLGSSYAPALGNIVIQLNAIGAVPSVAYGQNLISSGFNGKKYYPGDHDIWDTNYNRFQAILGK
jgi:sugar (pentulose or hexulose) kinase